MIMYLVNMGKVSAGTWRFNTVLEEESGGIPKSPWRAETGF